MASSLKHRLSEVLLYPRGANLDVRGTNFSLSRPSGDSDRHAGPLTHIGRAGGIDPGLSRSGAMTSGETLSGDVGSSGTSNPGRSSKSPPLSGLGSDVVEGSTLPDMIVSPASGRCTCPTRHAPRRNRHRNRSSDARQNALQPSKTFSSLGILFGCLRSEDRRQPSEFS